jgi:hypothetical protein
MDTAKHPVLVEDSTKEMLDDLLQLMWVLMVTSIFELCYRFRACCMLAY